MTKYIYAYHQSRGFILNFKLIGNDKNEVYQKLRTEYASNSLMQKGTAMRIDNWNEFNLMLIDAKYHHIRKLYLGYHYNNQHYIPEIYANSISISLSITKHTTKQQKQTHDDYGIIECTPSLYVHASTLKRRLHHHMAIKQRPNKHLRAQL